MKYCLFTIAIFLAIDVVAQTGNSSAESRRQQVENSLAPNLVYGDSAVRLNLEKQIAAYNIRGVSIAVGKDYKIDWAKGYGWADAEEKRPVNGETKFQVASISKSINSLALLKLVQQGKIDLEKDVNTYLKTWEFPYDGL